MILKLRRAGRKWHFMPQDRTASQLYNKRRFIYCCYRLKMSHYFLHFKLGARSAFLTRTSVNARGRLPDDTRKREVAK